MSVLKQAQVSAKYMQHFVGAHADFGELQLDDKDPRHAMVERHNPNKLRPVLVFLDAEGHEVARHTGRLNDAAEALRLDRFVSERHYEKQDYKAWRASAK